MEIHVAKLDRKKLAAMPDTERGLLFLLAHANNEINVLSKLILMMRKDDPPSPILDHVETGQVFTSIRLLIGKLHEAWELFRTRVLSNQAIATVYLPRLEAEAPEAASALQALKRYFGAGSALSAIRNNISFHYSDKRNLTEANFQQLSESEPLQFYLTKTVGNSFYHAAELIVQLSVISLMKRSAPANPNDTASGEGRALAALYDQIIEVSAHITELFSQLIAMLSESVVSELVTEQVPDGPKLSAFALPYFFDEDDTWPPQPLKAGDDR
jgi:hypothetical protein